ncbi:DNA-directed RNA polymerase subunit P [Methanothermococcus okinawensis]|uniref:DNA-directed RNA polymerase subunit Rpo12 n=1 Tax=Methanothermococcus okinawensis (strain DSM 14208 / JCM 11175 / IH1) TaxID=647113 RepID=F8ANR6_METOI|nr:DNA-directed RNA polymerase subunit P [Methanothermococcus okinawensis]AEH06264.1 RNA polymerase Rbp10 [Methanothermococcus okinawensis IH1]
MAEYRCSNCGKIITQDELGMKAKCPYCSNKILIKLRPRVVKLVKAR